MNFRLLSFAIRVRSSFWFLPFVMIAASMVLAAVMMLVDQKHHVPNSFYFHWIQNIGPAGARAIFSTIAGSTITVAGVIFSIAMVVLTMASSQFGPRLIPTFMRVGRIQFGIGLFVGCFVYCLLMLTFVPDQDKAELLPVWSVIVGLVLGVGSFLVLIMLIHEIATFIQAPNVTDRVAKDMRQTFSRIFPVDKNSTSSPEIVERWESNYQKVPLCCRDSGYIRTINFESLTQRASCTDSFINLLVKPGHFVIKGQQLGTLFVKHKDVEEQLDEITSCIHLGPDRDLAQDAEYAVDQMVEIAVRALSPGINDPFTAMNCIDKLSDALGFLATRQISQCVWDDEDGTTRVIGKRDSYDGILDSAFSQIRQHSLEHPGVTIRMVEAIRKLAEIELAPDYRKALSVQLGKIDQQGERKFPFASDYSDYRDAFDSASKALRIDG